jgi:hypothetical protein
LSAVELQKEYDKQKLDEKKFKKEEEKRKKLEAEIDKIVDDEKREAIKMQIEEGKRLKKEAAQRKKEEKREGKLAEKRTSTQLHIKGVTKTDIAGTPKLETFFGGAGLNTRFQQQRQGGSLLSPQGTSSTTFAQLEEEPQQITFTQPTTRTFKPFEGGGV